MEVEVNRGAAGLEIYAMAASRRGDRTKARTSKRRGELAELEFLLKASSLGFAVSKPYGDSDRYDFIVDSGRRLLRVQVKSASVLKEGVYCISCQRCCNGVAIPYKADEIDYLAAYVFPEDAWFVIPVETFVERTSMHLFPEERGEFGDLWAVQRSVVPDGVSEGRREVRGGGVM